MFVLSSGSHWSTVMSNQSDIHCSCCSNITGSRASFVHVAEELTTSSCSLACLCNRHVMHIIHALAAALAHKRTLASSDSRQSYWLLQKLERDQCSLPNHDDDVTLTCGIADKTGISAAERSHICLALSNHPFAVWSWCTCG